MEQFTSIFRKTLQLHDKANKTPVVHALHGFFYTHQNSLTSTQIKRQSYEAKNKQVQAESLKYRSSLQERVEAEQKKHQMKREEELKRIKEKMKRKGDYIKEIHLKSKDAEQSHFKERLKKFRESQQQMQQFWSQRQLKRDLSYQAQLTAKSLYQTSVDRKRMVEQKQQQFGFNSRVQLLRRHAGRQNLLHKQIDDRKKNIHEVHEEQIGKALERHQEIVAARQSKVINDIGNDFAASEELLSKNQKQLQKRIKDKIFDYEQKRTFLRTQMKRNRTSSASATNCRCTKVNNVEEDIATSKILAEKSRHTYFGQTLKKHQKSPGPVIQGRKDFLVRSHSMRSSVNYNKDTLNRKKHLTAIQKLKRQKQIADALQLKKSMEVQRNCLVRVLNVK